MKTFAGAVVSDKMSKVVSVLVERSFFHPRYGKLLKKSRKIHATNEKGAKLGQKVIIVQTKPAARTVNFKVMEIIGVKEPKKEELPLEEKTAAVKKKIAKKSKTEEKE